MTSFESTTTIVGRLTADPVVIDPASGHRIASFVVAIPPRLRPTGGPRRDGFSMPCSVHNELRDQVEAQLRRGTLVVVTGRLRQRTVEQGSETFIGTHLLVDELGISLLDRSLQPTDGGTAK